MSPIWRHFQMIATLWMCIRLLNVCIEDCRLLSVEKIMGAKYRRATAFCLQSSKQDFERPDKFGRNYGEWKTYILDFLDEYYLKALLVYVIESRRLCQKQETD